MTHAILILEPGATDLGNGIWHLSAVEHRVPRELLTRDAGLAAWANGMRKRDVYKIGSDENGEVIEILSLVDQAVSVSPGPHGIEAPAPYDGDLLPLLQAAREWMIETLWPAFQRNLGENGTPPSQPASLGMCSIATPALLEILSNALPDGQWTANGGHPTVKYHRQEARSFKSDHLEIDGGLWDRNRQSWDGHYWVEGVLDGQRVIVDLTADQYGWDKVIVTDVGDPRYRASYRRSTVTKDLSRPTAARTIAAELPAFLDRNQAAPAP